MGVLTLNWSFKKGPSHHFYIGGLCRKVAVRQSNAQTLVWQDPVREVEALIEYIALFKQSDSAAEAREQILIEQREKLRSPIADMQR